MDPFSTFTTGVHSSIRILEVTYQLRAVDEHVSDLLNTTQHVNRNISEARRLRDSRAEYLDGAERAWMDKVIEDTEYALLEVARLIEPARVDAQINEAVTSKHRILWVLRDGPKVKDKHRQLTICHQSLTAVITALHGKGKDLATMSPPQRPEQDPPPYDKEMEALFRWKGRRRGKRTASGSSWSITSPVQELEGSSIPHIALEPFSTFEPWPEEKSPEVIECSVTSPPMSTLDLSLDSPGFEHSVPTPKEINCHHEGGDVGQKTTTRRIPRKPLPGGHYGRSTW